MWGSAHHIPSRMFILLYENYLFLALDWKFVKADTMPLYMFCIIQYRYLLSKYWVNAVFGIVGIVNSLPVTASLPTNNIIPLNFNIEYQENRLPYYIIY